MRMVAIPLALATFAAGSVLCPAATLTVDCAGGGEYLTIQEAVDSATSGDTLLIAPCVYEESVATLDKRLTFIGSGAEVTELRWSGDDPTLEFGDGNVHMQFRISDMRISREPVSASAIKWDDGHLELESCVINGLVRNWDDRGGVTVSNSELTVLRVTGWGGLCSIENSSMGVAVFLGVWFNYDQLYWNQLDSSGSEYGVLRLIGASADLSLNLVGTLESVNGSPCEAVGCTFGSIDIRGGVLKLDQCEVSGSIVMYGFSPASGYGDSFGKLMLTDCLVGGDIDYDIDHHGEEQWAAVKLVHNTVLGDVSYDFSSGWWSTVWPHHIRGNIVMGETAIGSDWAGWPPVISHNDFAGGATISASGDSIFANISEDPLFCGAPAGDYTLQECSPCAGTAHDGSDIGAFGVGCECWVVTEPKSWGAIKGMYR